MKITIELDLQVTSGPKLTREQIIEALAEVPIDDVNTETWLAHPDKSDETCIEVLGFEIVEAPASV